MSDSTKEIPELVFTELDRQEQEFKAKITRNLPQSQRCIDLRYMPIENSALVGLTGFEFLHTFNGTDYDIAHSVGVERDGNIIILATAFERGLLHLGEFSKSHLGMVEQFPPELLPPGAIPLEIAINARYQGNGRVIPNSHYFFTILSATGMTRPVSSTKVRREIGLGATKIQQLRFTPDKYSVESGNLYEGVIGPRFLHRPRAPYTGKGVYHKIIFSSSRPGEIDIYESTKSHPTATFPSLGEI